MGILDRWNTAAKAQRYQSLSVALTASGVGQPDPRRPKSTRGSWRGEKRACHRTRQQRKAVPVKLVEAIRLRCQEIRVNKGNPPLLASHSGELLNSYGERCCTHVTSIMLFNSYNSMLEVLSLSPLHRWRNRSTEKLDNLLKVTQLIVVGSGFELRWL